MNDNIERLKNTLLNENPILFLGAGFSLGGKLKNGSPIPLGNTLKKDIIKSVLKINESEIEYEELMGYTLSGLCQYCMNKYDPVYLNDFLTEYFSNTIPADYHTKLSNYFWKRIYTTNIDDLVETVYKKNEKDILIQQYPRKFTYRKDGVTEYFKLHGSVTNPSGEYTFSTDEYVDSLARPRDYRFDTLSSDMHSENFIFVGSNFEEINLDYYLKLYENSGYTSSRGKIFFINPRPSLLLKSKIERIQGTLIEWDTSQFLNFVDTIVNNKSALSNYAIDRNLQNLGFVNLKDSRSSFLHSQNYDSQLYLGFEPTWEDIFSDWDFIDLRLETVFKDFIKATENVRTSVLALIGKPYIGKSTFLKRLGNDLRTNGYETYYFKGRDFNYHPFLKLIRASTLKNFAIIVDNASYYYSPLKQLMRSIPNDKKLIIITASRPFFHFKWRYNLVGEFFTEHIIESKIEPQYGKSIVEKLDEKGFLGELKNISDEADRIKYVVSNNDVMSFLFSLTYGKGFISRLNKDLNPFLQTDDITKDILVALAVFNKLELPHFPAELISFITNNKAKQTIKKIDGFIKITTENNFQLRSAFFTSNILNSVSIEKIIRLLNDLLIFISAQVDDKSHTYWNEIHASLTKEKILRQTLKLNSQQIKILLYGLRHYYSDNFNFWIQLGIAEQREKDFEKALNHFKQAEALRPNSYMVQNSIGRNFLKQANSLDTFIIAKKYYDEGEKILLNLIENWEDLSAKGFATHSYIHEKIIFIEKFKIKVSNSEIKKMNEYLKRIIEKDPNDIMAKQINNNFISFLKRINKTSLIIMQLQDLSNIKSLFTDYALDIDELIDDQGVD